MGIVQPSHQIDYVTQTVGVGSTAVGRVVSYDQPTGVLKLWQDKTNSGFNSDGSLNSGPVMDLKLIDLHLILVKWFFQYRRWVSHSRD